MEVIVESVKEPVINPDVEAGELIETIPDGHIILIVDSIKETLEGVILYDDLGTLVHVDSDYKIFKGKITLKC